jgi:energy-coupling factor transporter ATP-binding protein EcfA2
MARRVTDLSGGERQRLALLSALAPPHALLLLDEPLAALDRRGAAEFKRLITQTPAATLITVPKGPEMPAA